MTEQPRSDRSGWRALRDRVGLMVRGRFGEVAGIGAVALAAGGAAMAFHGLAVWIEAHTIARLLRAPTPWFVIGSLGCVLAGSFVASWVIARFAPSAAGGGVLPVKLAFWRESGRMRKRVATVKLFASAVTLGSGVSMGPEGPSMQIGAATMSGVAGVAGVQDKARRAWCAAGAAAGLAAVFNAPLAAITFVLEEVIGDLHSRMLGRVVVAAVVGALIGHAILGPQPAFQSGALGGLTWRGWVLVPVVALIAAAGGAWFQKLALGLRRNLKSRKPGRAMAYAPLIGAFVTWVAGASVFLATGHPGIFGVGYGDITAAIAGELALGTAALLFVGKIIATAGAVGSGGCGGIFAPSLFIGAMGGAAIGALTSLVLPLERSEVAMLVMTGMAASLGAVIRTPLTCVLLIFEVTNQWVIVPALMLAAIVSQAVSRFVNRHDMYEEIMLQDGLDPHQVLPPRHFKRWREIPVSSLACTTPVTTASLAAASLRDLLARSSHQRFPVLDAEGATVGVLSRVEAERAAAGGYTPRIDPAQWIAASATIGDARRAMLAAGVDFLCVGDRRGRKLEAILTLHDLVRGESVLDEAE